MFEKMGTRRSLIPEIFFKFSKKKNPHQASLISKFWEKKPTPKVIMKIKYPPNTNYLEFRRGVGGGGAIVVLTLTSLNSLNLGL